MIRPIGCFLRRCGRQLIATASPVLSRLHLRDLYCRRGEHTTYPPAEATRQETASVFRSLVEKANDAIVVIQAGRSVYRNPAHARLFGYTPDNEPPDLFEAIAPEDRERVRAYYQQRLRGEAVPDQYELTILAADGRRVCVEVKPSVIEYAGRPASLVVTRDITVRQQAEIALRQVNEELERRVEARTAELQAANAQLQCEMAEREQV